MPTEDSPLNLPKVTVHKNGHKASPKTGGAFPVSPSATPAPNMAATLAKVRAQQTVFPTDFPSLSVQTFLYNASRHYIGGAPIFRWLLGLLLACSVVWFSGFLPGRWLGGPLFLLGALALVAALYYWRKRDFIRFTETALPAIEPSPLEPDDKIAIHSTGSFSVEGKQQRYTWLPGFYRTFATREHALMCLVREQQFLRISRWLPDEVGMWYVFFSPRLITAVRCGQLHFDSKPRAVVAVDYEVTIPAQNRFQRERTVIETIYIAAQNEEQNRRILADLLHDMPADRISSPAAG